MYLSDLIRDTVTETLVKTCVNKIVTIKTDNLDKISFICKDVHFCDDAGDCWIEFKSDDGKTYIHAGQGLDIWFDIKNMFEFEDYCSACDNYPGNPCAFKECPFKNTVTPETKWKEIGCSDFWD